MEVLIDQARLTAQFTALVAIDSPSYGERAMADYLTEQLQELGLHVEEDGAAEMIGGSSGNLYGFWPGEPHLAPLLLCAHMDTVAPALGKRAVVEPDGRIHSGGDTVLGADDLAAVAVILEVIRCVRESGCPHRPVEVLFSVSEETYCVGASAFDFGRIRSREAYVLDYEGPIGSAVTAAPTILDFTAEILGKAAHAGFAPEQGVSAVTAAARAVGSVPSGRVSERTTLNFGLISGGTATNIVPDRCTVKGEIRSSVHEEALEQMEKVRAAFQEACAAVGADLHFRGKCFLRAYHIPQTAPVARRYFSVCRARGYESQAVETFGGSDNNLLAAHGIAGIVVASAMHRCHSREEYTSVEELAAVAQVTADLLDEMPEFDPPDRRLRIHEIDSCKKSGGYEPEGGQSDLRSGDHQAG